MIKENTHDQEIPISKQLRDKERVFAALENKNLLQMINQKLINTDNFDSFLEQYSLLN